MSSSRSAMKKPRDYDAESGKLRVSTKEKRRARPPPPPESTTESELSATESEVEEEYEIRVKDVHRQRPAPARKRKAPAPKPDSSAPGEEPTPAENTAIAPADDFLVAIAYRQGTSVVQFETRSFFIPDCMNLFSTVFFLCELLVPNSLVHEFDPSFMSITFYLYVAHMFYYQVLRVRDSVGELTREQRRCLRHYENVGPAESWPVPTPLAGFFRALGCVTPPSRYYGKIIPKLPTFGQLTANHSLQNLNAEPGLLRVPIIPAMQQFLRNFGDGTAQFINGVLHPIGNETLTPGAAGPPPVPANRFVGLEDSTAAAGNDAQTLFFSAGWNEPTEGSEEPLNYPYDLKRSLVNRFNVPNVGDTATITGIESFLGFRDGQSNSWMRNLLRSAATVCRFFPGSTNLSTIGTITQEEIITPVVFRSSVQRHAIDDQWYRGRSLWTYSMNGKVNAESSGYLYKVASSAAPNFHYDPMMLPPALIASSGHMSEGPYFVNPAGAVSIPLTLVEIVGQPDPIRNALALMDEKLYDNLGGRARQ